MKDWQMDCDYVSRLEEGCIHLHMGCVIDSISYVLPPKCDKKDLEQVKTAMQDIQKSIEAKVLEALEAVNDKGVKVVIHYHDKRKYLSRQMKGA